MRESFPQLQAGDTLSAGYLNRMAGAVGRVVRFSPQQGYHGGALMTDIKVPPFSQADFIVTAETDAASRLYTIRRKVYDGTTSMWSQDNDNWELDATPKVVRLLIGDPVSAYWDELRGAFIPTWVPTRRKAKITNTGGIVMGGSGTVTFMKNGGLTSWTETAQYNHVYADNLDDGQNVFVQFYYDENAWVIEIPWC